MATPIPSPLFDDVTASPQSHPGTGMDAPAGSMNPPAPAGALPGVAAFPETATPALVDILIERHRQISVYGHTPEADAAKPLPAMYAVVSHYAKGTRDHLSAHGARSSIRIHAVKQAAALLAFIDRLDAEDAQHG